jgi:hypothetical protein
MLITVWRLADHSPFLVSKSLSVKVSIWAMCHSTSFHVLVFFSPDPLFSSFFVSWHSLYANYWLFFWLSTRLSALCEDLTFHLDQPCILNICTKHVNIYNSLTNCWINKEMDKLYLKIIRGSTVQRSWYGLRFRLPLFELQPHHVSAQWPSANYSTL